MSEYELPELPPDEELGIADESDTPVEEELTGEPGSPVDAEVREGGPPEPQRTWRGPLTLVALVAIAWLSSSSRALPDPAPAAAADTLFSSARALVQMVDIARLPHPTGSPEHARVRDLLVDRLSDLGMDVEVQTTTSHRLRDDVVRAATVRNVVARSAGTASTGAILLMAHYDSRPGSPGAADDASGVAAILETVRAIRAGPELRNDLIVLFTDAEELSLLGARAFVREHPLMADVSVVLNVDMRGGGGPSIMFETGEDNGWIVEAYQEAAPAPFANSLSHEVYRRLPNDTDFTPFLEADRQGLNFAGIGRPELYHQAFDTPSNFQEATLQHHGLNLLATTRELGARDLADVHGGPRVFFPVPALGLVSYWMGWVPAIALILVLAAIGTFVAGRRKGGGIGGAILGFVLATVATAGGAGAGWALFRWVRSFHAEYGALSASAFHSEGWYVLAIVAAAFALVTVLFGFTRRKASLAMLSFGAMALPLLVALYVSFAAPAASMNLQWPVLAGLGSAALVAGVPGARRAGSFRWVLLFLLALPVLALLVPLIELLWIAMSISLAPVLGALAVWTLVLILPLLDALTQPNRWWAPLAGLILAALFTGLGLLHARPSPERPTPTTLVYALDHDEDRAFWAEPAGGDPASSWVRGRVGILGEETSLDRFLEPPAPGIAGGPGIPNGEAGQRRNPAFRSGPAPVATAQPPEAFLAQGPNPVGTIRVGLRSTTGAEMITVWTDAPETRWTSVNGHPIEGGSGTANVRSIVHWGRPEDALFLELQPALGTDSLRLVVVEHHLRPSELVGADYFQRPPDLVRSTAGVSDRALLRSEVVLSLRAEAGPADTLPQVAPEAPGPESVGSPLVEDAPEVPAGPPDTVPRPASAPPP